MIIKVFFILGAPYSGKSTLISEIQEKNSKILDISLGKELRILSFKNKELQDLLSKGEFASDKIVKKIFLDSLKKINPYDSVLIDGFPRNDSQLNIVLDIFKVIKAEFFIIFIQSNLEILNNRCLNRMFCNICQQSFTSMFAYCKKNHILTKRLDDSQDLFNKRMNIYFESEEIILSTLSFKTKLYILDSKDKNRKNIINLF